MEYIYLGASFGRPAPETLPRRDESRMPTEPSPNSNWTRQDRWPTGSKTSATRRWAQYSSGWSGRPRSMQATNRLRDTPAER